MPTARDSSKRFVPSLIQLKCAGGLPVGNELARKRIIYPATMEPHVFTLGIEEEFQIIDPETRDLRAHIQ